MPVSPRCSERHLMYSSLRNESRFSTVTGSRKKTRGQLKNTKSFHFKASDPPEAEDMRKFILESCQHTPGKGELGR